MTKYQTYCARWQNGCGSGLCDSSRRKPCDAGTIPCDILFIGEALSRDANVVGRPFVGQTGAMIHRMISEAVPEGTRIAFTNTVSCVSVDEDNDHTPPSEAAVLACRPRLQEFIALATPKLLVAVGRVAHDNLLAMVGGIPAAPPVVHIPHPSHIGRQNAYLYRRAVQIIRDAVAEHLASG